MIPRADIARMVRDLRAGREVRATEIQTVAAVAAQSTDPEVRSLGEAILKEYQ